MKKESVNWHGKNYYLLGINQEGKKEWLKAPEWACEWYWSFGIVVGFTNNRTPEKSKDINGWTNCDSLFFNNSNYCYELYKKHFKDPVLKDNEMWLFLELMKTFYNAKQWAEVLHCNGSHITESGLKTLKNNEEWERINKIVIPEITQKIIELLGGANND